MTYWIKNYNATSKEDLIKAGKMLKEVKSEIKTVYTKFFGNEGSKDPYKEVNEMLEQIEIAIGDKITE